MLKVQLSCSHVGVMHEWPRLDIRYLCEEHGTPQTVSAVECREWKVSCDHCRYARWYGDSKPLADQAANAHYNRRPGHNVHVDYLREPETYSMFREMYGRTRAIMPWIRWTVPVSVTSIINEAPKPSPENDKPPF
jgi:hypothetical protein